jgi:hypothetical protein
MKSPVHPQATTPLMQCRFVRHSATLLMLLFFGSLTTPILRAQQPDASGESDHQLVQQLMKRIEQLEAQVKDLQASGTATATGVSKPPANQVSAETPPQGPTGMGAAAEPTGEGIDLNKTLLNIRGFSDVTLHGDNGKGDTTSFSIGQVDLFITSNVSDRLKFLSETVFEAGQDNNFGVDIERILLTYSFNDYLNIGVGRFHSAIGYYNTAYHHSTWFQTTTGRPFLFEFEDGGGILPIHNVGATISGRLPSGSLGLHYVAEVGNGRASDSLVNPNVNAVQNVVDENNGKSVNFEVFARPEAIPGLETGFSVYRDNLYPTNLPKIGQEIFDAFVVYAGPRFEWLNEALLIRHAPEGGHIFDTPGFYTQISRRWGLYRPYFRYQYVNVSPHEPLVSYVGLRHGPSVGLRYDIADFAAVKLQYDYTVLRMQQAVSALALQVGFTF